MSQGSTSRTSQHQLEKILDFPGPNLRCDCPICGGLNSFSAYKEDGKIIFKCFRASCPTAGVANGGQNRDDLLGRFNSGRNNSINDTNAVYAIPDYFSVKLDERCIAYLKENHCWEAYKAGRLDVMYDPKQDRICFMLIENGECYGASGRALVRTVVPKWYIYGNGGRSFFVEGSRLSSLANENTITVVEDCASACAVSGIMDCIALLGTNLHDRDFCLLKHYDVIYIALDKDATQKSIEIQRRLSWYADAFIVPLQKDLKYLETDEIKKVIYGASSAA